MGGLILVVLALYAAWKFYQTQKGIETALENRAVSPPGISYYEPIAVTQRPQQIQAFAITNSGASVPPGFAPAFGPLENQPGPNEIMMP
jgi:hypothetical protein